MTRILWFLHELRRRKVTRVAVIYAAVGIGALEGAQLLTDALGVPWAGSQLLAIVILAGFPLALALAWTLELGPTGVRRQAAPARLDPQPAGRARWGLLAGWGVAAVALSLVGWQAVGRDGGAARAVATLEAIDAAVAGRDWIRAFELARSLDGVVPVSIADSVLASVSVLDTLYSDPAGAVASWRPYDQPGAAWETLGTTPVEWRFPRAAIAVRLERDGYMPRVVGSTTALRALTWRLRRSDAELPDALHVPGSRVDLLYVDASLVAPALTLGDYLLDRHEVTNREYQRFVDAGGYQRQEYWRHRFERDGRVVSWDAAMAELVDRTGLHGPSTWYVGRHPDGAAEHPVTGVSWYEAAAYAAFADRDLPTLYHWYRGAGVSGANLILPHSNVAGTGAAPVGHFPAVSQFGAYDMAGNAREWIANGDGEGRRYTVGGGWDDPSYAFYLSQPQSPFDRSRANGIRLITDLGDRALYDAAAAPVRRSTRDYATVAPADDALFEAYRQLYDYDDLPLEAVVEREDTVPAGIRQRITFSAAYGGERMPLYLFLPRGATGPFETVVYVPGSSALRQGDIDSWSETSDHVTFLTRSGRAVAFPVLKSMFDREDGYEYRRHDETSAYRDHVLMWAQDVRRTLDYLETREDIREDRIGYFGYSFGGFLGPIALAVDPRFGAGVFYVAGLAVQPTQPVVDQLHFAPRVRAPVLMLNGEHDQIFPVETSARPLYELLGSDEKRQIIAPGGHNVPGDQLIRETLAWFDRHLGGGR